MPREIDVDRSPVIKGLRWTGGTRPYPELRIKGDTFPITWADDNNCYTSSGDPLWAGNPYHFPTWQERSGFDVEMFHGAAHEFIVYKVNDMTCYEGWGGRGAKPSGIISVGGVLYLAIQNTQGAKPPAHGKICQHGSDATILKSTDKGLTWSPDPVAPPMFPGHLFGGPAFVQFGKDNNGAPDKYVYAVSGDQWDNGSELRVGRVPADCIQNPDAWEFVASIGPDNEAAWTPEIEQSAVAFRDERHLGLPEMVCLPGIDRFLLLTWSLFEDFTPAGSELAIYDAPKPWGPFTLVHHEPVWESHEACPYCPRLPLAWYDPEIQSGYLLFSGHWKTNTYYRANVRPFRLLT